MMSLALFGLLPPELVLHILSFLPTPTISYGRITGSSSLLATSLVDNRLRLLSQQLMFESVGLRGTSQVECWSRTAAARWTTRLIINLTEDSLTDGGDSLVSALIRAVESTPRIGPRLIRGLELEFARGTTITADLSIVNGLQGEPKLTSPFECCR